MAGTSQLAAPISKAGRGLVAAHQQHHAVDRVAANGFLDVDARQVAGEHGRRAQVGFAVGEHRELHREAARFDDAAPHVLGQLAEVRVAGRQFRTRCCRCR
jgi:hypothetical protein